MLVLHTHVYGCVLCHLFDSDNAFQITIFYAKQMQKHHDINKYRNYFEPTYPANFHLQQMRTVGVYGDTNDDVYHFLGPTHLALSPSFLE